MASTIPFNDQIVAAINVKDLTTAIAWYREKLDMETTFVIEEAGWAEFGTKVAGFSIGLQASPDDAGKQGNATITLGVSDIAAARATMEARGVQFDGPTNEMPGMVKLATFHDLDGNTFMLAESLMEG